ncbi:MAG: helix-turn-helix transcriptional regulator [Gammaproteobacteria bacterium]|nr:helix-turn-helix transcriptional regulator [Gammaproteobacteria bacterium]MYF59992.1 helix-turn-helix transcriptional regulator [Gammaproteobacteria bacterium]
MTKQVISEGQLWPMAWYCMDMPNNSPPLRSANGPGIPCVDDSLFEPLSRAASTSGIDLAAVLREVQRRRTGNDDEPAPVLVSDYFRLLGKLADLTSEETVRMSRRPLLPGAFHFVMSQAAGSKRFDGMLRKFANGFNLLHGRVYNHVMTQGDKLIYAIDNTDFPTPFELTDRQFHSFLECIVILMHTLFGICAGAEIDSFLLKVTTKRRLRDSRKNAGNRLNQLAYWGVPTAYGSRNYALIYDYSVAALPVKLQPADLPRPNAIFGEVARLIESNLRVSPANVPIVDRVVDLILTQTVSANELAMQLNLSARTLRRRLAESNTSFQEVRRKALNARAKRLLSQDLLAGEVAEELDYSDERSFRRAFIRWNRVSPSKFRTGS